MEDITPTLILLWDVKRSIEKGQSVSVGVRVFLDRNLTNPYFNQVEQWWTAQNNKHASFDKADLAFTRKYLLEIIETGLKGQSILDTIKSYERELIQSCEDEIQAHIAKLPLLLLLPLMGFIFPAMMLLLVGPLLSSLSF